MYLRDIQQAGLGALTRSDIEGFFERQQNQGLKSGSLATRLGCLYAFIRFLVDEGIVSSELLFRKIRIKAQSTLRKDINRDDVDILLSVIEGSRGRAMVILLLRTGMRIGELLNIKMSDINLEEQTIRIYESMKTGLGRVAYFSNDAAAALYDWLLVRDYRKERLFYGMGRQSLSYSAARKTFVKYIGEAGLVDKGYTLHCLRHTFATNLLNAGMPIEVLRDLLGHSNLVQTQHYAKLSDRTREAEFFRAMAIIEGEDKK
jgi:integrase/recombinase XerD